MKMINDLMPGNILSNQDLGDLFGCGNSGGMRRANRTNSLVIISSHVKSIYDDRWDGDILFYTGMGQRGDQSLSFLQNKTLAESDANDVDVYLFENFKVNEYTYLGPVALVAQPFEEQQPDDSGNLRKVYIFPLKLKQGQRIISQQDLQDWNEKKIKQAKRLSHAELKLRASKSTAKVSQYRTSVVQFVRDQYVVEYAKQLANGVCQLCDQIAPFADKSGSPYLETHHVIWLARGGEDTIENTVALCPNCHKRMHVLDLEEDKAKLITKITNLIK